MAVFDFAGFLVSLRKLRGEEQALATLLERADRDGSASEAIASDHRLALTRIRAELGQKQAAAPGVRELLVSQINELRCRALEVRGNMEELREHADLGGADPKLAEFSAQLQRSYRDLFNRISHRELDLGGLQEEIRQLDRSGDHTDSPPPSRPAVLNVLDAPASIAEPLLARSARSKVPSPGKAADHQLVPDRVGAAAATAGSPSRRAPLRPASPSASAARPGGKKAAMAVPGGEPGGRREATRDRKVERRYPYQAPVRIRVDGRALLARSGDISGSGMFLEGQPTLAVGTAVVLGLAFHDFPLEIAAEVVYETPGVGMGVRFTSTSEVDARYLGALLEQLRKADAGSRGTALAAAGTRGDRKPRPR